MPRYEECLEKLNSFETLEDGWMQGGGVKINIGAIGNAKNILALLHSKENLSVFPIPNGGVQIEYFDKNENRDYEIEIYEKYMNIDSYENIKMEG